MGSPAMSARWERACWKTPAGRRRSIAVSTIRCSGSGRRGAEGGDAHSAGPSRPRSARDRPGRGRRRGLTAPACLREDPVLLEPPVERTARHAELLRGLHPVPARELERLEDLAALVLSPDVVVVNAAGGGLAAGIALAATSVAVVYTVMMEYGFNRTDYGKTILAACFITDLGTVPTGYPAIDPSTTNIGQGLSAGAGGGGFWIPPDTTGAVGTTEYVQWVNAAFAVYEKSTGLPKSLSLTDQTITALIA